MVAKNHLAGMACSWMLTPDKYQVLTLDELPVLAEEFQSAIRWQIRKLLSFPIEDAYIDSISIPPAQISNPKKLIMIVAAQASYIQPMTERINNSGLKLITIDIPELAWRNISALYESEDDLSTALIYLQDKNSNLIISRQKLFYLSRRLDWSLDTLLKSKNNLEAMQHYVDNLALEIRRSFDYFQSQWRVPAPSRVIIVPQQATPIDVTSYLSQRLAFPLQALDLNQKIETHNRISVDEQGRYLTLIGGALREELSHATTN